MNGSRFLATVFAVLLAALAADATSTDWWIVDTAEELLEGRGSNVEVTADGLLRPVVGWTAGVTFDEPVVMAAIEAADGSLIVGTGHPARLYRVSGSSAELLSEIPAEQITALLMTTDGAVLITTVAPGVLYRWNDGGLNEVGRVGEGGLWDLALFNGVVVAAGGPPASLFRLEDRGLVRWRELPDVHASCLEVAGDRLLVGTSDKGLILSIDRDGTVGILADSPFTEISDLAVGDGSVWATALVGEPVTTVRKKKSNGDDEEKTQGEAEVTVTTELKLPKVNGKTATSEVIRLTPDGGLLSIHRFLKEVASAIAWDGRGVLVGTGYEGEVWRFVDGGGARLAAVDAVQVVGVVDGGAALLTQGPAGVFWRGGDDGRNGRFRSPAKQFKQPVHFGEYRVEPSSDELRIRFRSGVSETPDGTWLEWSEWLPAAGGICDGLSMAGAFAMGAEGVQMGTRMLCCSDSPVHDNWKQAIVAAKETDTVFLNQASRPALRALRTERTEKLLPLGSFNAMEHLAGIKELYFGGDMEAAIPLSGQVVGRIDAVKSAADIVQETMSGFYEAMDGLASKYSA